MSRIIYTLIIFFSVISLFAQNNPSCNGLRYRVDVFENVKVTKDIEYSEATTIGGKSKKLFLDVYEPVSDVVTERPVIVLAFGGSFISGTRSDMQFLCERFAKNQYWENYPSGTIYAGIPLPRLKKRLKVTPTIQKLLFILKNVSALDSLLLKV